MSALAHTRLVTFKPYPHRAEQCALGLLVWLPDGTVQAHPIASLRKAKELAPAYLADDLRAGLHAMAEELTRHPDALALYISGVGAISLSADAGTIRFACEQELETGIKWSLAMAAEPQKPAIVRERAPVSRLFLEIKHAFSMHGWMAAPGNTLQDHKIIARHPLSRAEDLTVDFALQNGALHCMQTVDYRTAPTSKRQEATAKFLTLGYAQQVAGEQARRYAIIAGSTAPEATPALRLAERTADDIFLLEAPQDMERLFCAIAQAMGQPPLPTLALQ